MKVCFISGEYPPMQGGIADYTKQLASTLHDMNVGVSVLTSSKAQSTKPQSQKPPQSLSAGQVDRWPVYPTVDNWNFRAWAHILGHLQEAQPEVVHIQYQTIAYAMHPAINLLPLWLKRRRSRPGIVTTFHDLGAPYLFPKAGRLRHKITLALMRGSDRVIVTNGEDWQRACALLQGGKLDGQSSQDGFGSTINIVPIGNNIPANPPEGYDRSAWRAQMGITDSCTVLSYFGFLNQSKGVDTLLESLRSLVSDGIEFKLLMVGAEVGDSDPTNIVYRKRIIRSVDELELGKYVIWTGYGTPRDVSGHLLSSDICVLPFRDGASFRRTTLLTALAHGLPVISTRGRSERLEGLATDHARRMVNGEHAVLVSADDAAELASTIKDLTRQPAVRLQLGENGRRLAESFAWPLVARKTLSIYEEILKL